MIRQQTAQACVRSDGPLTGPAQPVWPANHRLDDISAAVYSRALAAGSISASAEVAADLGLDIGSLLEAIARLVELRLLRPDADDPRRLTPRNPELAAASFISPLEAEIHHRRYLITGIRTLMNTLVPQYTELHRQLSPAPVTRTLQDSAEVSGALHLAADGARTEVLSVRPRGADRDGALDVALARDMSMLGRGVRLRALYQHSVRTDPVEKAAIRRLVAGGVEVRTTDQLRRPFSVFDREIAFTPDGRGVLELRSPALAQLLAEVFEGIWTAALPYPATREQDPAAEAVEQIQQTIANLLAEGLTDEVVARRLGMSVRSCRRHIALLFDRLNAASRFQAGTRAASQGLVHGVLTRAAGGINPQPSGGRV